MRAVALMVLFSLSKNFINMDRFFYCFYWLSLFLIDNYVRGKDRNKPIFIYYKAGGWFIM